MSSYITLIKNRRDRNPCLSGLIDHFNSSAAQKKPSTIHSIEYPSADHSTSSPISRTIQDADLPQLLRKQSPGYGRILIVEDIQLPLISLLGETLNLDPLFFAGHISTDAGNIERNPAPPSIALFPSQIAESGFLHCHYQQVTDLGSSDLFEDESYNFKTDSNIPRNVRRLPPLSKRQLGLARCCISAVVKKIKNSWICLILCDPPIQHIVGGSGSQKRLHTAKPLNGGFEDFLSLAVDNDSNPISKSVLGSLLRYFQIQSPPGFKAAGGIPTILSLGYYPTRIALAEWNIYIRLISRYFKYYEYTVQDNHTRLHDDDITDLQRWRRRCMQSQNKLALLATFVEYWLPHEKDAQQPWQNVLKDIKYIRAQLKDTYSSLEQIIPVVASMVQLLDSRRAILEATSVTRLTFVALVFVPLSWVASLFSMADGYTPGQDKFWVYFVTALPVLVIVLALSRVNWPVVVAKLHSMSGIFMSQQVWNKKRQAGQGPV